MDVKIELSQIPLNYPMCLDRECPQADTCLRQLAEKQLSTDIQHWAIIRPSYLATLEGACPHYRPAVKVHFAKGFTKILGNLPYKQMLIVTSHLTNYFSRRTYYRVRKGERLLSPSEQQTVLKILKNCGVSNPLEFDEYIETYDW